MSNQLEDNGAVIGYRPNLEYKKEKNNKSEVSTSDNTSTDYSGNVEYSSTLSGFSDNLPSKSLNDIDYVIQNIKTLIDKLSEDFIVGNWNEYNDISILLSAIESNNEEYINNFINYHKDLITGSIVPELIGQLHNISIRLNVLDKILKKLYYGDENISNEDAQEIDNGYVEQLKKFEVNGDTGKINYVALSYDSILNRSITMYAYGINKKAINLSKITSLNNDITTDKTKIPMIKRLYSEVNDEINYRSQSYDTQQSIEIMQKTLYNYYNRRSDLITMYDMYDGDENFSLINRLQEYQYKADKAIENIARIFAGNQYYVSEITNLEQEKRDLMQNYIKLNYNS